MVENPFQDDVLAIAVAGSTERPVFTLDVDVQGQVVRAAVPRWM